LRIVPGEKRPIAKEWQKLRPTDMTPDYLASFADGEGIGVNLGAASWSAEGNSLYSIDVDDDENFARMIELNPTFAETLQTNGARGGNFWLYVTGACRAITHPPPARRTRAVWRVARIRHANGHRRPPSVRSAIYQQWPQANHRRVQRDRVARDCGAAMGYEEARRPTGLRGTDGVR